VSVQESSREEFKVQGSSRFWAVQERSREEFKARVQGSGQFKVQGSSRKFKGRVQGLGAVQECSREEFRNILNAIEIVQKKN
jgi:hypothetical protein